MKIMQDLKKNNCRLCKKVYCCIKCREKHETKQHNIFPGCDICLYGQTLTTSMHQNVISHIKIAHWPLHCLLCKRLFGSTDELFQHVKCPLVNGKSKNIQKSPYTPLQSNSPYSIESVEYGNRKLSIISNLASSTPMHTENGNYMLEKIQEVIVTPVDCSGDPKESNLESSSLNLKRKVTFCDTPITESFSKKPKTMSSVTDEQHTSTQFLTPSVISGLSTYYTANDNLFEQNMENNGNLQNNSTVPVIIIDNDEENVIPAKTKTTNLVIHKEETIWINTVRIATTEMCSNLKKDDTSLDFNNQFFTPMVPKKKINIEPPPSIVQKEQELSIKFEGPVQISSTPNSSIIPVKSAPNMRDIFKNTGSSTSKSELEKWGSVRSDKFSLSENFKQHGSTKNIGENLVASNLWSSMTNLMKNIFHGFSTSLESTASTSRSIKRYYSDPDLQESSPKRYKVTDVQCRRTIRDITPINKYMQSYRNARSKELRIRIANSLSIKTFAEKATQTDDYFFNN